MGGVSITSRDVAVARRKRRPRAPKTPAEWQEAVNGAVALLRLEAARQYGMVIAGAPDVDQDRCLEIIQRARAMGIVADEERVHG